MAKISFIKSYKLRRYQYAFFNTCSFVLFLDVEENVKYFPLNLGHSVY